jgi:hypothetical protein
MQAANPAAGEARVLKAFETSTIALEGQRESVQQYNAYLPTAGDFCDSYFTDQPWEDVCFVPVGCTSMMEQLLNQLHTGTSTCSSSQPPAPGTGSSGSRSSNSSEAPVSARALQSPAAGACAELHIDASAELHTDACRSLLNSPDEAVVKTWCLMELPPDCIVNFEGDAFEAGQQHTAQQRGSPGSSGFSSSSAAVQHQHQPLLLSAACASQQYFSAAAALCTGNHAVSAAYHRLPACSDFPNASLGCSTPAEAAAEAARSPTCLQDAHIHALQQQMQQLCVEQSCDSLAELPLHNPYVQRSGARCSWEAGAECFVGEF